tara:strand:+ start:769 stop:1605 length:837 start_codon:yes stop_codon:yes gene_type:complete
MADRSGYIGRAPSDSSVTVARQTNQPTGVTTTFVFNSGYDVGYLDVYVNGSKLINALDYIATDTQNISLTTAAVSGDVVEFVAYKAFNLTNVVSSTPGDFTVDGSVTATSFIGDGSSLTGIANTNNLRTNFLEVSGISTLSGGLTVAGVSTFTGNVVLDANLDLQDNDKILLGTGDDLEIYHTGSHSFIVDSGTGDLYIRASAGYVQDVANANQTWLKFNSAAGVEAHFAGNKKLETTTNGVTVTGSVTATSFSGSGQNLTNLPASGDSNDITASLFN